jgi:L-rhamnose mutarotase
MKTFYLSRSTQNGKKFMVRSINNRTIHFGQAGAGDYTIHKNPIRQQLYINRHKKNENWDDLTTAGAWSRWILWSKPSLKESIKSMEQWFGIRIVF